MNMAIKNYINPSVDGLVAVELDARKFWQSRATVDGKAPELPELVDLDQLARDVRAAFQGDNT